MSISIYIPPKAVKFWVLYVQIINDRSEAGFPESWSGSRHHGLIPEAFSRKAKIGFSKKLGFSKSLVVQKAWFVRIFFFLKKNGMHLLRLVFEKNMFLKKLGFSKSLFFLSLVFQKSLLFPKAWFFKQLGVSIKLVFFNKRVFYI